MERPETSRAVLDDAFRIELERRLHELDECSDGAFGELTSIDWAFSVVFFILIPLALVWLFR
jgi:hypothetical protein